MSIWRENVSSEWRQWHTLVLQLYFWKSWHLKSIKYDSNKKVGNLWKQTGQEIICDENCENFINCKYCMIYKYTSRKQGWCGYNSSFVLHSFSRDHPLERLNITYRTWLSLHLLAPIFYTSLVFLFCCLWSWIYTLGSLIYPSLIPLTILVSSLEIKQKQTKIGQKTQYLWSHDKHLY